MNKFGLHTFGLPSFGLSDFRLTSFGGDGDGGRKAAFHSSLVDAWFMSGYSNSDKPKEIVGVRGNAIELNNFLYAKNSGFGIYANNFTKFAGHPDNDNAVKYISSGLKIIKELHSPFLSLCYSTKMELKSMTVRVTGLDSDLNNILLYEHVGSDGNKHVIKISSNGIYTLPESLLTPDPKKSHLVGFYITDGHLLGEKIVGLTIEQIPEKEGYLCFDGVDDYAECNGLPILEDYTVICKRKWFNTDHTSMKAIASKRKSGSGLDGAFIFERIDTSIVMAVNYGSWTPIEISQQDVVYQTASSYNGHYALKRGILTDTEELSLGSERSISNFAQCAIAYFALYSRTLTTQEIEEEKIKLEQKWKSKLK